MMQNVQSFLFLFLLIVLNFHVVLSAVCIGQRATTTIWLNQNGDCQDVGFCQYLQNCTCWHGNLVVKSTKYYDEENFKPYFPKLREITGYLLISLCTLKFFHLFPGLTVIRGGDLILNYALVIYYNEIKEVYFPSLTTILNGGVHIGRNHRLCYVNTIRWKSIIKDIHQTGQYGIYLESNKLNCDLGCLKGHCHPAPGHDGDPKAQYCWGPGPKKQQNKAQCQRFCNTQCGPEGCLDGSDHICCHHECLGGCSAINSTNTCHACRKYRIKSTGQCVSKCPRKQYLVDKFLCQESCPYWSINSTEYHHYLWQGECVTKCPVNYISNNQTKKCEKCKSGMKCNTVCKFQDVMADGTLYNGALIRVPSDISKKGLVGCSVFEGSLTFQLQEGTGKAEDSLNELKSLKVLKGHLKIQKSSLKSLNFLSSLEVIETPQNALLHNKYVMAVYENSQLSELWPGNESIIVSDGGIFFQYNPRLCPLHIRNLQDRIHYKNGSKVTGEVSLQNNGHKVLCDTQMLVMHVEEFIPPDLNMETDMTAIECNSFKCVKVTWNFTMTSAYNNILFYAIYFKELQSNQEAVVQLDNECQNNDDWNVITVDIPKIESLEQSLFLQSKIISKLTPYTRYAFYIKEIVSKGEERSSHIHYINISQDLPSEPLGVEASFLSENKILLKWRAPSKPNGIITAFKIYYNKPDYSFWEEQKVLDWCSRDANRDKNAKDVAGYPVNKENYNQYCNISCVCDEEKENSKAIKADREAHNFNVEFQTELMRVLFTKNKFSYRNKNKSPPKIDFSKNVSLILSNKILTSTSTTVTQAKIEIIEEPKVTVNGNIFSYVISGLDYFEDYELKVCGCTVVGCRRPSSTINLDCGIVQARTGVNLTADNLDSKMVRVQVQLDSYNISWIAPQKPNAVILKYEISIRYALDKDALVICRPGYLPTYIIRKSRFGNYVAKIRAISPAGNGSWTEEIHFKVAELSVTKNNNQLIIGIISAVSAVIVALLVFILLYMFLHRKLEKDVQGVLYASVNPEYMNSKEVYIPDEWELNREKIELIRELGQGSFGMVFEGIAHGIGDHAELRVAVKTTNENASIHDRIQILQEASIMKAFNCNHVVKLIGVVSQGQPTFVVMELMGRGDLKSYLKERRPDDGGIPLMRQEIYQMVAEIADGMAYLAARKFVHCDLAARNCMVASDFTVKIGDFGMARDIYERNYYRKDGKSLLPIRWMAPESLKDGIFSTASDVWSFGVVLWEICTLASQPYQGKTNEQVLNFVLSNGHLDYPEGCDYQLREFMSLCWHRDPKMRPSFLEIVHVLENEVDDDFVMVSFYHEMKRKALEDIYMKSESYIKSDAYTMSDGYTKGDGNMQNMLNRSQNRKSAIEKSKERLSISSLDSGTYVEKYDANDTPEEIPKKKKRPRSKRNSAVDSNACETKPMLRVESLYDNHDAFSENMQYGDTPVGKSDLMHPETNRELRLSEIFYGKPIPV
uniref:Tyrosine-protein kinase receptor n=1 Tax=Hydra vulgaris TaxID=6087 RepID=T2MGU8_HYDVU